MEFEKIHSTKLNETLYKGRHESGLMVYVLPKQGHSKSYASFAARVGSIDNEFVAPGEADATSIPDGVAHFLEHKLFEQPDGTNAFDQYSKTGASANAFTSFNTTAYIFSSTDKFYENLEILLEFVGKPYFTDENVAKEQGIIGQEIRMYEDDPGWRVFFNSLIAMYKNHPVRKDIAGTVESISEINKDILYKCYNTFYNPSNMMLFTCGNVECDKVAELVDKYVTSKPIVEIKRFYPNEPKEINQKVIEQNLSVASPLFIIAFKDTNLEAAGSDMLKKQIITEILIEMLVGKSSKVYNELYEKGLINDSFEADFSCESGYAYTSMGGESINPEEVKAIIMNSIESSDLTKEEFERCKKVLIGRFLRLFNSVEKLSNSLVSSIYRNVDLFEYIDLCEKVTLNEIIKRKEEHFIEDNCVLSIVRPY